MINLIKLRDYPSPEVLDENLKNTFLSFVDLEAGLNEVTIKNIIFILEIFLDCHDKRLSYIDFNRNLNHLFSEFVAFVYIEFQFSNSYKYSIVHYLKKIIYRFCDNEEIKRPYIVICESKSVSKEIGYLIENYNLNAINKYKLKYYNGWYSLSSDGKEIKLYLHNFYLKFGLELTDKVSNAMGDVFIKYPSTTARYKSKVFSDVLSVLEKTLDDSKEFYSVGESIRVNKYVENLFLILKVKCKVNGRNLPYFYHQWKSVIKLIQDIFIHSNLWEKPLYDFFSPDFKQSNSNFKTHRVIIDGQLTTNKLITNIPLHVSDSEAIAILIKNITNDVSYVVDSCNEVTDSIMARFSLRFKLAKLGTARNFNLNSHRTCDYIDMSIAENQCSTWNKLGYSISDSKKNKSLLNSRITGSDFVNKYSVVQSGMLYPFLYLIVNEHPEITNSWLENFQLYDKYGNKCGLLESGNSSIAVGYKPRKGYSKAEQKIILTNKSKYLFNCLELLTRQAREYMKDINDKDYKYLLLSSKNMGKPRRLNYILTQSVLKSSELNEVLENNRLVINRGDILPNLSLTKFRASRAILIYIETNSLSAVSEALGHTRPCPKLLSRYLPIPILNYLQDRWVRVFQYSIIYESMKDSVFLSDVINLNKDDLETFLSNHKLNILSNHLVKGNVDGLIVDKKECKDLNEEFKLVIPISKTLYAIFKCFLELVDLKENVNFSTIAIEWYEMAKFVLKTLDESFKRTSDPEIFDIINYKYNKEPILKKLREVVYEL
jgi:hypothetical protein